MNHPAGRGISVHRRTSIHTTPIHFLPCPVRHKGLPLVNTFLQQRFLLRRHTSFENIDTSRNPNHFPRDTFAYPSHALPSPIVLPKAGSLPPTRNMLSHH